MANPYLPPESSLCDGSVAYNPSFGWKILLFVFVPLEIWSQYEAFVINEYEDTLLWRVFSLCVYLVFYVGLYGLAFSKRIGISKFWLFFLPVLIITDLYDIWAITAGSGSAGIETVVVYLMVIPLVFIFWFAVFTYQKWVDTF